jgi:hypothetical protein
MSCILLQQALDALKQTFQFQQTRDVIAALEQELAKPEQEPQIPTKIFAPNLEQILNAAGFYRRDAVCCGDYEKCIEPCTPKGEWLAKKELAKPEQEPVAWAVLRPDGRVKMLSHQQGVEVDLKWTPLYTAPPRKPWQEPVGQFVGGIPEVSQQREWVGLTDAHLMKEFGYSDELLRDTAYRVEQILKEKNT